MFDKSDGNFACFLCRVTKYQYMYILVNQAQSLLDDEKLRYIDNMVYILYWKRYFDAKWRNFLGVNLATCQSLFDITQFKQKHT